MGACRGFDGIEYDFWLCRDNFSRSSGSNLSMSTGSILLVMLEFGN